MGRFRARHLLHNFLCPTWHGVADALIQCCLNWLRPKSIKHGFQFGDKTDVLSSLIGVKTNSPFELIAWRHVFAISLVIFNMT
uniref:Uncharacterized protein n=1 Tax=Arundo donax TaxID=35708 RepID=A0A0A9I1L2_ARUDO